MNKIFKVIWSKARGCYVVASEFAKSHTKSGRAVKAVAMAAAVALTVGVNGLALAEAANPAGEGPGVTIGQGSETKYKNDVALGENATTITNTEYTDDNGTHSGGNTAIGAESKAIGVYSTAFGIASSASGTHSTSIGVHAAAEELDSTAIGNYATASGVKSTAIGNVAKASGEGSLAAGVESEATGKNNTALGDHAQAIHSDYSTALGVSSTASGNKSTAAGIESTASGIGSTALGDNTTAQGDYSTALGGSATASKENSTAAGIYAKASGKNGTAIGHSSLASGETNSTAVGSNAEASGSYSTALGKSAKASAYSSIATGLAAKASGSQSLATGQNSIATSNNSIAIGTNALTGNVRRKEDGSIDFAYDQSVEVTDNNAVDAVAIGNGSWAAKKQSTAMGASAKARGENSTAAGIFAEASGINSTAIGENAKAGGTLNENGAIDADNYGRSTAVGGNAEASGNWSTALGKGATSSGEGSTASGVAAKANGKESTAIGHYTVAGGDTSVAIGSQHTTASGAGSVAVGETSVATGNNSLAFGASAVTGTVDRDPNTGKIKIDKDGNVTILTSATNAIAVGAESLAEATSSTALGYQAAAIGEQSMAMGYSAAARGKDSTAIGNSTAKGNDSIAIGSGYATASGNDSIAIGKNAVTGKIKYKQNIDGTIEIARDEKGEIILENNAANAVAIGDNANAEADYSTALGSGAKALQGSSVAMGANATAGEIYSTAVGYTATASGKYSTASGGNATASGDYSMAVGYNAKASEKLSTALGYEAKANGVNNVALGANSNDKIGNTIHLGGYGAGDADYTGEDLVFGTSDGSLELNASSFKGIGGSVAGTVSVGYTDKDGGLHTRTITNVAAGMISKDSTDAINGSQLYAVAEGLQGNINNVTNDITNLKNKEQYHTVNGKYSSAPVQAPDDKGNYSGEDEGNLLIAKTVDTAGNVTYDISLNNKLDLGDKGSVIMGDTTINYGGLTIKTGDKTYGDIIISKDKINVGGNVIHNAGTTNGDNIYDVVNVDYLKQYVSGADHKHTVNGKYKTTADAPVVGDDYVGDNLLIKATEDDKGIITYDISLNNNLDLGTGGSVTTGDTIINNKGIKIGKITINEGNVDFNQNLITNVKTSQGDKYDVVNVEYLEQYITDNVKPTTDTDTHIKEGEYSVGTVTLEDGSETQGVQMDIVDKTGNPVKDEKGNNKTVTITDVAKASDVGDVKNFKQDVLNQDGSKTTVVDAINNIDNRVTEIDNKVTNIEDNIDDIAKEAGKHTEVTVEGGDAPKYGEGYVGGNLQLKVDKGANGQDIYDVKLNNNLDLTGDGSIKFGDKDTYIDGGRIDVGNTHITNNNITMGDTVITNNKVTTKEVQTGNTTVNNNGLTIKGDENHTDITINQGDVSMGGNVIHNVAPGVKDDDAVNVSQLKELDQHITNNSVQINKLGSRIDKVGAGAAALAALHPLDFDPDDKFYLSAGYGNYRGENAVAVGAFYQPNDDTLFSVSSTVGNDDDMINAGITWRFGQSSHQSRSKKAMAKEIIELRTEVAELKAMVYSLTGYGLDLEKSKLFPDTPEKHWAYDYVAVVAGNGILEGYPDGYFDGDRPMTRYEMAAVVYRLLQKGVQVDNRMIQEFAPELARVRVDTLTHYNDGTPHIQRVRVIKGRG